MTAAILSNQLVQSRLLAKEKGTGTMKLFKNYIKIKTKSSGKQGGFIGTDGKYFTLKRISGKNN